MEVDVGGRPQRSAGDGVSVKSPVANDPPGRHQERRAVLPPGGGERKRGGRGGGGGQDEVAAGADVSANTQDMDLDGSREQRDGDPDPDRERDKDKGRKRRKYRRSRPSKKVWLWRKELAEAAGAEAAAGASSPGALPALPTLLGRIRASASHPNTTQFIMEDHTDLQGLDLEAQRGSKTSRARDSSFSIDSDDDLSSSPEDEAYLSKEFSNTYEDVHVERLGTMTKLDLIQEYLQLEQRVDVLERRLNGGTGTDSESETAEGETPMEPAMAEKIRIFQEEIQKLVVENEQLLQENQRLQSSSSLARRSSSSLSSSIDSESDSSTSSGSSTTSSSGQSRASRTSKSSAQTRNEVALEDKVSDVEMASVDDCEKTHITALDQEMETELNSGEITPKSNEDNSVVSSVVAH
ncbi:hypothetical protein ONE63_002820 [Megalurothrips usitatus]|uniref:Protein HEXIM1 n=1 Tax=Megalurothrips usitatus TaxID=439358 RepID=A0AAV7X8G4_9NEOP|nr:hypothetical protein ONE63_002820 [Megalurothrips usitatus]